MIVSFMLIDNDGELVLESADKAKILLSTDGSPFELTDLTANEIGSGMYCVSIPEERLRCSSDVLILVQADGCQNTIYEYTPTSDADEIAAAVWRAKDRTLTSLNVGNQKANQTFITRNSGPSASTKKQGLTVQQILGGK